MKRLSMAFTGLFILQAGQALADQVILDDLIVDGSACIGFDCVNGENFGFDTIRLKENNTRIKFDDTSNSGSFPNTDWQLTANDSTNGGANKFSIDDITNGRTPFTIEATAPSNSLFVDDGGRVGFGTSTPVVELHVKDGDTPTLRLEQDGSSGFTPQTWDVAGNETNFFVRDVTNGSQLPFKIFPGADHNSLVIAANNNVGVGIQSPAVPVHVVRNGFVTYRLQNTAQGVSWDQTNSGNGHYRLNDPDSANIELDLDSDGNLILEGTLTVQLNGATVPDYVFKKNYELMPLKELEDYIEINSHLPGVPSADEIAKTGRMNMTEMQMKLLQKIEELTLYVLDQEQMIARLNDRINAMTGSTTAEND
ncbi:MAG: hypothetical protein ACU826_00230 [Gammaproteobacteria bacterium]